MEDNKKIEKTIAIESAGYAERIGTNPLSAKLDFEAGMKRMRELAEMGLFPVPSDEGFSFPTESQINTKISEGLQNIGKARSLPHSIYSQYYEQGFKECANWINEMMFGKKTEANAEVIENKLSSDFTVGQKLEFDVYGTLLKGVFISTDGQGIEIEVMSDSAGVSKKGEITNVHKTFRIK